ECIRRSFCRTRPRAGSGRASNQSAFGERRSCGRGFSRTSFSLGESCQLASRLRSISPRSERARAASMTSRRVATFVVLAALAVRWEDIVILGDETDASSANDGPGPGSDGALSDVAQQADQGASDFDAGSGDGGCTDNSQCTTAGFYCQAATCGGLGAC